uniref:B-cell receptor CD22-like n=1 Tax=Rhabditophanes sp. KR3021 TaxID=114890 RepID=A0AC35U7G1_9BILA
MPDTTNFIVLSIPPKEASPHAEVKWTWHHNGLSVTSNQTHFVSAINGDLIVVNDGNIDFFGNYLVEADFGNVKEVSTTYRVDKEITKIKPENTKFAIVYRPKDVIVGERNRSAIFECVPNNSNKVKIDWFVDDKLISGKELTEKMVLSEFNRRLSIYNPFRTLSTRNIHGTRTVKCRVSSILNDKQLDYAQASITFQSEPVIDKSQWQDELYIKENSDVKIQCKAKHAWPRPKFVWWFNGKEVSATNGGFLKISNFELSNYGFYQCDSINSMGSDTATVKLKKIELDNVPTELLSSNLKLKDLPASGAYLSKKPASKSIAAGNDVTLQCEIAGQGEIIWKFGESFIKNARDKFEVTSTELKIFSVQASDTGDYVCLAKDNNGALIDEATATITVISSKLIEYGPSNQSMLIGSNIEMPCKLSAEFVSMSDISVNWYWNNKAIPALGDILHRVSIKSDNSLSINQVGPDNIGEYRCKVRTSDGKEESVSAWLKIIEKPSMAQGVKAEFINKTLPSKVKVWWTPGFDGNSPLIKHSIEMRTKGSAEIWSNWEMIVENVATEQCCSTYIDNLKPSSTAEFRVIAYNRHGAGKASMPSRQVIIPQQPPAAAPRNVAASARSSNSVMVYWQPPPSEQWNGDILGYNVRYRLNGYTSAGWNVKNISNNVERYVLLDPLITWRDYEIQVAAYNDRGLGIYSTPPIIVTTLEGAPLQSPQNVKAKVLNSTAMLVFFDPPDQQMIPGQILGYKVQLWKDYYDGGDNRESTRSIQMLPTYGTANLTVANLDKFGHYNLTVIGFTSAGDSPRSEPYPVVTSQDTPGAVKNLNFDQVLFSSVTVLWDSPVEKNGIINSYKVRYWKLNEPDNVKVFDLPASNTSVVIEDLSAQTKYIVDVVAFTDVGEGEIVEAKFESGVPPELPGKTSNLRVSAITGRTCIIDFIPGFDGHTIIQKWHIEAKIGMSSTFIAIQNITSPKAKSLKITGLRPNTRYALRLVAENIKGRGEPSEASEEFSTEKTVPEQAPDKVEAEPQSGTSIKLFWSVLPHNLWNGDATGYLIQYKTIEAKTNKPKHPPVSTNGFIEEDDFEDGADFEEYPSKNSEENWKEIKTQNTRVSEFVINELKPFTSYNVRVLAENIVGRSEPSPIVQVKTFESEPSAGPANIQAKLLSSKKITLSWSLISEEDSNGKVSGYIINVYPIEGHLQRKYNRSMTLQDPSLMTTDISNLRPSTPYQVEMCGYNIIGIGKCTQMASPITTSDDVPDQPIDVAFSYVSEREVRVKWMPPDNANGIISGYSIRYWKFGTKEEEAINAPIPNNIYWFTTTGLTPNTTYYFGVQAMNARNGVGQESLVKIITTNLKLPQPLPMILEKNDEVTGSGTELHYKWVNPNGENSSLSLNESPVRFVQIEYKSEKDSEWIPLNLNIPIDKKAVTIFNLIPNTEYKSRCKYIGDFQESIWSMETEYFKTNEKEPSTFPGYFNIKPYESTSIYLEWNALNKELWNSETIGYRIEYKIYSANESFKIEEIPLSSKTDKIQITHILKELVSFKHYIIRIQAFNKIGNSLFSKPQFTYVGYSIPKQKISFLNGDTLSSSSISLNWKKWVNFEDDMISGYKIKYTPIIPMDFKGVRVAEEEVVTSEENKVVLNELKKYTEYQVSVCGFNRAGDGESSSIRIKTKEDVPGPISKLKFKDILTDSVNVTWHEPNEPNGDILTYLVSYHTTASQEYAQDANFRVKENFIVLDKLRENTHYSVSVKAETLKGFGTAVTRDVRIGAGTPGTPRSVAKPSSQTKSSVVLLKWKSDVLHDSSIIGFVIQAKRLSAYTNQTKKSDEALIEPTASRSKRSVNGTVKHLIGEWVNLYNKLSESDEYEIDFEDLQQSSIYTFRVLLKNEIGLGNPSEESEHVIIPSYVPKKMFYYQSWFYLAAAGAAVLLVVIFAIALCCLCKPKKKSGYDKRKDSMSENSLQFVENKAVNFELSNVHDRRIDFITRPNTNNSWLSADVNDKNMYGSIHSGEGRLSQRSMMSPGNLHTSALYGSLATDNITFKPEMQTSHLSSFKPDSPNTAFLPNMTAMNNMSFVRSGMSDIPVRSMYDGSVCFDPLDNDSEYGAITPLPISEMPQEQNYYEQCIRNEAPSTITYASSGSYSISSEQPRTQGHYYTTSSQKDNTLNHFSSSNHQTTSPDGDQLSNASTIQDPGISLRPPFSSTTVSKATNLPKNGLSSFV